MIGSKGFLGCRVGIRVIAPEVCSIGVEDEEGGDTLLFVLMDWRVLAGGKNCGRTGDTSLSTGGDEISWGLLSPAETDDENQISAIRLASSATLASLAIARGRRRNVSCLIVPIGTKPDERGFGAEET